MRGINNTHTVKPIFLSLAVFLGMSSWGWAQRFENQFIEFKIPENWECHVEGTEWVCMSNNPRIKKETLVVFAAKVAGPNDTIKDYLTYLQKPRTVTDLEGKSIQSEVRYARHKDIGGHTWVDALHINGEIPGFITRYMATTYQELGILVTYSVLESRWDAYEGLFRTLVDTLKPKHGTEPELTAQGDKTGMTSIPISSLLEKTEAEPEESPEGFQVAEAPAPEDTGGMGSGLWILLGVIGAGVIFVILRRRKSAKPPETTAEGSDEDDDFDEE